MHLPQTSFIQQYNFTPEGKKKKKKKNSVTRMTARVLKQDPNTLKVGYSDKSQPANFQGNPFFASYKQHLNNS